MNQDFLSTPVGWLQIRATHDRLVSILFSEKDGRIQSNSVTEAAKEQLNQYLEGQRKVFDLPFAPSAQEGTAFQKEVWEKLLTIPYGETISYAQLAERINNPKAVRAVGTANSKNQLSIIVPCHRVIGANGNLTGYAGGIERKAFLLELEQKYNQ